MKGGVIVAIWLPFKANANERGNHKKARAEQARLCRICGKATNNGGAMCKSCADFIRQKHFKERKRKK